MSHFAVNLFGDKMNLVESKLSNSITTNIFKYFSVFVLITITAQVVNCQSQKSYDFSLLFLRGSFQNNNLNDADAALKVWAEMYGEKLLEHSDIKFNVTYKILENFEDLVPYLANNQIDMLNVPASSYVQLPYADSYLPLLSSGYSGRKFEQYVLIVRKDSGLNNLDDLKGSSIIMQNNLYDLSGKWIDVELWQNGFEKKEKYFSEIENESKEIKAINKVFFKKINSAIVTYSQLEIANELNPQILNSIKVIGKSDLLLTNISLINKNMAPEILQTIFDAIDDINTSDQSKQILSIFKTESILNITIEELESVKILMEKFNSIK